MTLLVTSNSLYAQYPVVKKIGNDTLVLMTLKQGQEVNKKFEILQDSLEYYKKKVDTIRYDFKDYQIRSGLRLQKMYESYWQEYENLKSQKHISDSFRHMYMANKLIYTEREKVYKKEITHATVFATVLGLMAMLFAAL